MFFPEVVKWMVVPGGGGQDEGKWGSSRGGQVPPGVGIKSPGGGGQVPL